MGMGKKEYMAMRAALEITPFSVINLGIGIPTLIANYMNKNIGVMIHGENGLLGIGSAPDIGKEDPNIINAGGFPCTLVQGGSYFDSATSFGMIRKRMIDITFLGALEVDEEANLANWIVPGKSVPGMGGGMELAQKAKKVVVLMNQVDKYGNPKMKKKCTLPITASHCVDMVITDMGVFKYENEAFSLTEVFEGIAIKDVLNCVEGNVHIAKDIKIIPTEEISAGI